MLVDKNRASKIWAPGTAFCDFWEYSSPLQRMHPSEQSRKKSGLLSKNQQGPASLSHAPFLGGTDWGTKGSTSEVSHLDDSLLRGICPDGKRGKPERSEKEKGDARDCKAGPASEGQMVSKRYDESREEESAGRKVHLPPIRPRHTH